MKRFFIGFCFLILFATESALAISSGQRLIILSGNSLWTPINIGASLVAWWDAQDTVHIALSGSNVTSWTDRKGGLAAVQGTGASQPTWSAITSNNKAGVTFSNQFLSVSSATFPSGANASTMAVAGKTTATAGFAIMYGSASNLNWRAIDAQTSNVMAGLFAGDISSSTAWLNTDRFVEYTVTSGAQQLFADGTSIGTSSSIPATSAGSTFFIGKQVTAGNWTGVIQQIVIANVVLSTCQQQKLEGWESWYDGKVGANLPVGHPYKNGPPLVGGTC